MSSHDLGDGNIRIWKDYTSKGEQKLVTAFSSLQGHKPGVRSLKAVVDWQQQSGYLVLCFFKIIRCNLGTAGCVFSYFRNSNVS